MHPQQVPAPGYAVPPGYHLTPIPVPRPPRGPSPLQLAPGRSLASAVAVFLGGWMLLEQLTGGVSTTLSHVLPGTRRVGMPVSAVASELLLFLATLAVVILGLLLGRGPLVGRTIGSVVVGLGVVAHAVFVAERAFGSVPIPREIGVPIAAVFANPWFAVVALVGFAWLLSRRPGHGWLTLLGALVLIPLPHVFGLNGWEYGASAIVMYLLAAIVGGAILVAGKPLRD